MSYVIVPKKEGPSAVRRGEEKGHRVVGKKALIGLCPKTRVEPRKKKLDSSKSLRGDRATRSVREKTSADQRRRKNLLLLIALKAQCRPDGFRESGRRSDEKRSLEAQPDNRNPQGKRKRRGLGPNRGGKIGGHSPAGPRSIPKGKEKPRQPQSSQNRPAEPRRWGKKKQAASDKNRNHTRGRGRARTKEKTSTRSRRAFRERDFQRVAAVPGKGVKKKRNCFRPKRDTPTEKAIPLLGQSIPFGGKKREKRLYTALTWTASPSERPVLEPA